MRVHMDPDVCQGHGLCEVSAPGVFHLREEDGQAYVLSEEVSPQRRPTCDSPPAAVPSKRSA